MGDKELTIDWSKFKSNTKGKMLEKAKQGYIEFCKMLNEADFELVGDYIGNREKVELTYKLDDSVRLNMSSHDFKRTHKSIINLKSNLKQNNDVFIKFVGLSDKNSLIVQIKAFDGEMIEKDIRSYNNFTEGRQDFYSKLREINGRTSESYRDNKSKINIYIDNVRLNMTPNHFKRTYNSIVSFKNSLINNGDSFINFTELTSKRNLIAKIKTFDGEIVNVDIGAYSKFNKGRRSTYDYCISKGCKILSPYVGNAEKILVDFNCEHQPHWITPNDFKKGFACPICDESKGERVVRLYLESNNIEFKQEYRFDDCKHKLPLPFDFYIPEYNLCIEFDGIQHFEASEFFGEKSFEGTQKRDNIKNKYCKENNINLLRIPYYELDNVKNILDRELERVMKVVSV